MIDIDQLLPQWTRKVVTEMTGRDPLGLSRVSNIITDYLLTGIITTTDRARYYSFYCWAVWHINLFDIPKRYQDFVDGFRKREAMVALATLSHNENTSPVGVLSVQRQLERGIQQNEINCDFQVLPSNRLGGYGQYYSGSLFALGLMSRTSDGIDHLREGNAENLAKLFQSTIESTPYIKKELYKNSLIPVKDFKKSQKYMSIDSISEPFTAEERNKLINVFFGLTEIEPSERTRFRNLSLTQILYIVSEYEKNGYHPNRDDVDWYLVYPAYYYNSLWPEDTVSIPYSPPANLTICTSLWKQFCLQQFISQAMESLMFAVLETLSTEHVGLDIDTIVSKLLQNEFFSTIQRVIGINCDIPYKLLYALGVEDIPNNELSLNIQRELSLLHPRSEKMILDMRSNKPETMAACAMLLLSVIYCKWRGLEGDVGFNFVMAHAGAEFWAGTIFPYIDKWFEKSTTWENTLQAIIEKLIVDQHDRIMYEKQRLDSCWLHPIEGKLFKDQDYGPRWRSSRHDNVVSILIDLKLLEVDEENMLSVTSEGKSMLSGLGLL